MALKLEIEITADDKASKIFENAFSKSAKSVKTFETKTVKAFANIQTNISGLVKKIAGIAAAFASIKVSTDFTKSIIKTADTFEKLKLTLATVEGSIKKANESFKVIQEFTAKTPYSLEEVTSAFVKLRTYGIDPLSNNALRVVGDVASAFEGMGKRIDDVVEALADAQMGEFERLKEFGIKASKQGEQVILRYVDAHGQMVEKVIENNEQVIRSTLLAIWNEKYGGQMKKLSGTWSGMVSNLEDNWTRFKQLVADSGFMDTIKDKMKAILEWSNEMFNSGKAQKWAKIVSESLKILVEGTSAALKIMASVGKIIISIGDALIDISKQIVKLHKESSNFWVDVGKGLWGLFATGTNELVKWIGDLVFKTAENLTIIKRDFYINVINPINAGFIWIWKNFKYYAGQALNKVIDWMEDIPFLGDKVKKLKIEVEIPESYEQLLNRMNKYAENMFNIDIDKIKYNAKKFREWADENKKYWENWTKQNSEFGKFLFETKDNLEKTITTEVKNIGNVATETLGKITNSLQKINQVANTPASAFKETNDEMQKANQILEEMDRWLKENEDNSKTFWQNFIEGVKASNENLANLLVKFKTLFDKTKEFLRTLNWDKIKSFGKSIWEGTKSLFQGGAKEGEEGIIARVKNTASNVMMGAQAGGFWGAVTAFFADQLMQNEKIQGAISKVYDAIQKLLDPIAEVIAPTIEALIPIIESFKPIFEIIADSMKPVAWILRGIYSGIAKIISFFTGIAKSIWEGMKKALDFIKNIVEGIKKILEKIGDVGKKVGKGVKNFLNSNPITTVGGLIKWHSGGIVKPIVAHDGMYIGRLRNDEVPAVLQEGEYVINRRSTQKYRPLLEAINQGKEIIMEGANIVVNVYAKTFDRRFVEDELLPMLEDFHKRGKLRWE